MLSNQIYKTESSKLTTRFERLYVASIGTHRATTLLKSILNNPCNENALHKCIDNALKRTHIHRDIRFLRSSLGNQRYKTKGGKSHIPEKAEVGTRGRRTVFDTRHGKCPTGKLFEHIRFPTTWSNSFLVEHCVSPRFLRACKRIP